MTSNQVKNRISMARIKRKISVINKAAAGPSQYAKNSTARGYATKMASIGTVLLSFIHPILPITRPTCQPKNREGFLTLTMTSI